MKVHIIGEDNRSNNLRLLYENEIVKLSEAEVVFCPIPFTRDNIHINESNYIIEDIINLVKGKILVTGALNEKIITKFNEKEINYIDILEYEEFSILNAEATSEGAIKKAIELTNKTLCESNILILGYGRIGKCLAHNLSGFTSNIFVEARKSKDIALIKTMGYNEVDLKDLDKYLDKMDIIFNTIPSLVIDKERVNILKKDVCVIDLASAPGGVDFEELAKKNITVSWYLGVPSKDFPYSAAIYIKSTIDKILRGENIWEKKLM